MSTNTPPATLNWLPFDPNRSDLDMSRQYLAALRFDELPEGKYEYLIVQPSSEDGELSLDASGCCYVPLDQVCFLALLEGVK